MEAVGIENKRKAHKVSGATEARSLHMHALLLQNLPAVLPVSPAKAMGEFFFWRRRRRRRRSKKS